MTMKSDLTTSNGNSIILQNKNSFLSASSPNFSRNNIQAQGKKSQPPVISLNLTGLGAAPMLQPNLGSFS